MKRVAIILAGLAVWWLLVPLEEYLRGDGWHLMNSGLPLLLLFSFVVYGCFALRKNEYGVLLWVPLVGLSGLGVCIMIPAFFGELRVSGMSGGGSPLGGVAMLLSLAITVAVAVAFILCLASYPKKLNVGIAAVALINSLTIGSVVWKSTDNRATQIITLKVLDHTGTPVTGAVAHYNVYGYGPGGERPSYPEISDVSQPTDANGLTTLRSKQIRHEILFDVTKPGYGKMTAHLEMAFENLDSRLFRMQCEGANQVASFAEYIHNADPITLTVYLPDLNDLPRPLYHKEFRQVVLKNGATADWLSLQTHFFSSSSENADLGFSITDGPLDERGQPKQLIKITAATGGIAEVSLGHLSDNPVAAYERIMQLAPQTGYSSEITLEGSFNTNRAIYFRSADGHLYALLLGSFISTKSGGDFDLDLWVNTTGSRSLLPNSQY